MKILGVASLVFAGFMVSCSTDGRGEGEGEAEGGEGEGGEGEGASDLVTLRTQLQANFGCLYGGLEQTDAAIFGDFTANSIESFAPLQAPENRQLSEDNLQACLAATANDDCASALPYLLLLTFGCPPIYVGALGLNEPCNSPLECRSASCTIADGASCGVCGPGVCEIGTNTARVIAAIHEQKAIVGEDLLLDPSQRPAIVRRMAVGKEAVLHLQLVGI